MTPNHAFDGKGNSFPVLSKTEERFVPPSKGETRHSIGVGKVLLFLTMNMLASRVSFCWSIEPDTLILRYQLSNSIRSRLNIQEAEQNYQTDPLPPSSTGYTTTSAYITTYVLPPLVLNPAPFLSPPPLTPIKPPHLALKNECDQAVLKDPPPPPPMSQHHSPRNAHQKI